MSMIVRCRDCNKELVSHPTRTQCCGCSNMMTVRADSVSAIDLSRVVMVSSVDNSYKKSSFLTKEDIAWQEQRRQRKIRKLDFEIR
jgi:hypothetical protein